MKLDTINRRFIAQVKTTAEISSTQMEIIVDFINDLSHDFPEVIPYLRTAENIFTALLEIQTIAENL